MKTKAKNVSHETSQLEALGRAFLLRRLDLKLNLGELETKTGITSLTISKLEKGRLQNPTVQTLYKIASVLKLNIKIQVE